MLGEAASKGLKISDEAAEVIARAVPQPEPTAAPAPEPTLAEAVVEDLKADAEEKFELPTFAPVPDDEFAGFEEEEAEQTIEKLSSILETDEEGYSDIEDADELRAELHKLKKQLGYQKELRATSERKRWADEAKEKYPLANVSEIQATSRNAFLKAAGKSHNQNYDHLSPILQELEEARKKLMEDAKAEGRKAAVESWGQPTTTATVGETDVAAYEAEMNAARGRKASLAERIGIMRKHGRSK
jgi:hypothetical protein